MSNIDQINLKASDCRHSSDDLFAGQKEDLNSLISHELRTPLTSIQGALKLLQDEHFGSLSETEKNLLDIAVDNADRLTRLANAIDHEAVTSMLLLSSAEIEELQLENDLYLAFERQEFQLFYQPIICTETITITGFEALARWQHPHKGWISPIVFIPLAEKAGLIDQLGIWSFKQACYQLHIWQQQFPTAPLTINVNFSTVQLLQPNLVQKIKQILQEFNIVSNSLKLEITETVLIQNHEQVITVLFELRSLGIQFYLDNFGIGYSSLGKLQELPVDALKIDRSFFSGKMWDISEMILLLAERLGLGAIAEGVETAEELAHLRALGCKQMQGFFFSKPVDSEAASRLLATSSNKLTTSNTMPR
jgi:EAL domain-containing protein (putative c-di-GMP-specific phosphodiesterase class I)